MASMETLKTIQAPINEKPIGTVLTRIAKFAKLSDLHGVRFLLAIGHSFWAINMLRGETFREPPYQLMIAIASEPIWAFIFTLMAVLSWYSILMCNFHSRLYVVQTAVSMAIWWLIFSCMAWEISDMLASASEELSFALAASLVFIRASTSKEPTRRRATDV